MIIMSIHRLKTTLHFFFVWCICFPFVVDEANSPTSVVSDIQDEICYDQQRPKVEAVASSEELTNVKVSDTVLSETNSTIKSLGFSLFVFCLKSKILVFRQNCNIRVQ